MLRKRPCRHEPADKAGISFVVSAARGQRVWQGLKFRILPAHDDPLRPAVSAAVFYAFERTMHVGSRGLGSHHAQLDVVPLVAHDTEQRPSTLCPVLMS